MYHKKVVRRMHGLHKGRLSSGRKEHGNDMLAACNVDEGLGIDLPNRIEGWPSPQQHPANSGFSTTKHMVEFLLDTVPGSMSLGDVNSNSIADTVQNSAVLNTSCQLPTIDESLDFLIKCLSKAS
ncbi:unnamed protein product [Peronospora farinosa]|uniref:Uncharacterized protein n=1 Tax=Peronospora farinosa TaxID=134698 RepID=A0ABN8CFL6_9STRA|nr:unnamed protein product [Peronospora farinosa]